ncbi:kinase-like domain-containing protein [Cunninghamella echinulata]|nr:kinase-like domain-containing protein [Cunninghamella echinulata]
MKKKPRVTERANILKEVQIMRNIHHPNIVQLIQFLESDENYFLVLDLCEGGELFYRIVDLTYFSEDLSKHIMTQLAQAVYHLHEECGVVHRDIKPENILFDPIPIIPNENRKLNVFDDVSKKDEGIFTKDLGGGGIGQIKLADFGLSKIIWDKDTLTPCGTIGYTAPEIVTDQRYSKSVDMWALGCVLYTMLCGFPPFYDESLSNLSRKVARGEFAFLSPWWDPISEEAKDLIRGLLCVDPTKRYNIVQVLQHPWINDKPIAPQPIQRDYSSYSESDSIRILAMRNAALSSVIKSTTTTQSNPSTDSIPHHPHHSNHQNNNNIDHHHLPNVIHNQQSSYATSTFSDVESSASSTKRKDVFSPGMATLKEIFDITAAVQRMAEENVHRGDKLDENGNINKSKPTTIKSNEHPIQANIKKNQQPGFALNMNNATLLKNRKTKQVP